MNCRLDAFGVPLASALRADSGVSCQVPVSLAVLPTGRLLSLSAFLSWGLSFCWRVPSGCRSGVDASVGLDTDCAGKDLVPINCRPDTLGVPLASALRGDSGVFGQALVRLAVSTTGRLRGSGTSPSPGLGVCWLIRSGCRSTTGASVGASVGVGTGCANVDGRDSGGKGGKGGKGGSWTDFDSVSSGGCSPVSMVAGAGSTREHLVPIIFCLGTSSAPFPSAQRGDCSVVGEGAVTWGGLTAGRSR